jgi:hypothetical protein
MSQSGYLQYNQSGSYPIRPPDKLRLEYLFHVQIVVVCTCMSLLLAILAWHTPACAAPTIQR